MSAAFKDLETIEHHQIIEELKEEIRRNPDMRHRIILKAIKTAESREVRKAIREFCRQSFDQRN